jgi:hypothetical protein
LFGIEQINELRTAKYLWPLLCLLIMYIVNSVLKDDCIIATAKSQTCLY